MSASEPIVEISFTFNGVRQDGRSLAVTNPALIDINEVAEDAVDSNTSYGYSGRHDHGKLPSLNNDPKMGRIVSALLEAKKQCDKFLTEEISKSAGITQASQQTGTGSPAEKKPRLDGAEVGDDDEMGDALAV